MATCSCSTVAKANSINGTARSRDLLSVERPRKWYDLEMYVLLCICTSVHFVVLHEHEANTVYDEPHVHVGCESYPLTVTTGSRAL